MLHTCRARSRTSDLESVSTTRLQSSACGAARSGHCKATEGRDCCPSCRSQGGTSGYHLHRKLFKLCNPLRHSHLHSHLTSAGLIFSYTASEFPAGIARLRSLSNSIRDRSGSLIGCLCRYCKKVRPAVQVTYLHLLANRGGRAVSEHQLRQHVSFTQRNTALATDFSATRTNVLQRLYLRFRGAVAGEFIQNQLSTVKAIDPHTGLDAYPLSVTVVAWLGTHPQCEHCRSPLCSSECYINHLRHECRAQLPTGTRQLRPYIR